MYRLQCNYRGRRNRRARCRKYCRRIAPQLCHLRLLGIFGLECRCDGLSYNSIVRRNQRSGFTKMNRSTLSVYLIWAHITFLCDKFRDAHLR